MSLQVEGLALTGLLSAALEGILGSHFKTSYEFYRLDILSVVKNLREGVLDAVETVSAEDLRKDLPQAFIV